MYIVPQFTDMKTTLTDIPPIKTSKIKSQFSKYF